MLQVKAFDFFFFLWHVRLRWFAHGYFCQCVSCQKVTVKSMVTKKFLVETLVQSKKWSEMKTCILWSLGEVLLWSQVLYWSIIYHLHDFFVMFLNRKVKRYLSHSRLWFMSKRIFFVMFEALLKFHYLDVDIVVCSIVECFVMESESAGVLVATL